MARLSLADCCRILGVPEYASAAEVKRAFRKKAKRLHPDVSGHSKKSKKAEGGQGHDSSAEMLELLEAYRTLSDPSFRARAESECAPFRTGGGAKPKTFDYHAWLFERKDPESRAKLIFFDLFHALEEEAVAVYLNLKKDDEGFSLFDWLDREDFMDCGFILAEELEARDEILEAFGLLARIAECEAQKPYFRHFFPEAIGLLMKVLRKIGDAASLGAFPDALALKCFERALELGLGGKDAAAVLLLMAECSERIGDRRGAAACRSEAERLAPQNRGARKASSKARIKAAKS